MSEQETQATEEETTETPAPETAPAPETPAPEAAPEPETPPKPAKKSRREKRAAKEPRPRRGGGWLPTVVVLAFALGTAYCYLEWRTAELELAQKQKGEQAIALSVLTQASDELAAAKASFASHDFGDGLSSLRRARLLIHVAKASAHNDAAQELLVRAEKTTGEAMEGAKALSKDVPEQIERVVEGLKACQVPLAQAWATEMRKDLYLASRYKQAKHSLESALTLFESSSEAVTDPEQETLMDDLVRGVEHVQKKLGETSEKALKEMDKLENKLEDAAGEVEAIRKAHDEG